MTTADVWHAAMKRARQLQPDRIARAILQSSDTGLRAARFDADGGRTSRVPCSDDGCPDGPEGHSHHVVNDPTGNAATRGQRNDTTTRDRTRLAIAEAKFIGHARAVIRHVAHETPMTWADIIEANQRLRPGQIQAALDLWDGHLLPPAIQQVSDAIDELERLATAYLPRSPSEDEKHWDNREYNDNDVCAWHLAIHRRYRRRRVAGLNICDTCLYLSELLEQKPPQWLLEAEIDLAGKPKAWRAALSRCMDELGIPVHERDQRSA